jgi:hypothetical protein
MSPIGNVQPVVGLAAAPDRVTLGRLRALLSRFGADMAGGDGPAGRGIIGYDRGDPAHSFAGPVARVASPTRSIASVASPAGVYTPVAEFQNGISADPALDPYSRLLWARMRSAQQ